jgi:transketolase
VPTPPRTDTVLLARRIRGHVLRMTSRANASHVGTCLSMADILAVLYGDMLHYDPSDPASAQRDRLVLSKGHGAAAMYAVLAEAGFFDQRELEGYCTNGTRLAGHVSHRVPGVEFSTGALGHGLGIGAGMALAGKRGSAAWRVVVILSDGECDEGSIWEAALFAPHHRLDNLVAIIDYNKIQSFGRVDEVLALEPLADKWRAFGWHVVEVDGHDHAALRDAFGSTARVDGKPTLVIAHTVKGKGVSFMEDELAWHYKAPSPDQLRAALAELGLDP